MNIDSIKNGIVIDHIQAKKGMEIYEVLELEKLDCSVAIITNAKSQKMGRKDIIKINKDIKLDLDILGFIDPNITINIIKNDERVEKFHVKLPEKIVNVIKCKNPRCITSVEQGLDQVFVLTDKDKKYVLEKGTDVVSSHAYDFISKRLAPANLVNDGKQTPMKGHPVFVAQHATATCCRGCLYKWHHISKDKDLTKEQVDYVVRVIMRWIKKEVMK